jgi:TATA-box binding protein (TBP) (component of TFIID and TFIIIB)
MNRLIFKCLVFKIMNKKIGLVFFLNKKVCATCRDLKAFQKKVSATIYDIYDLMCIIVSLFDLDIDNA